MEMKKKKIMFPYFVLEVEVDFLETGRYQLERAGIRQVIGRGQWKLLEFKGKRLGVGLLRDVSKSKDK